MAQTTPFTAAEITDIRRYAGFPAFAAIGYLFGGNMMATLDLQCANMSDAEQAVLRTVYLAVLPGLETAIDGSGEFMNTDVAAVWKRNKSEASDRRALFNAKRRDMCAFIGIAPGDGLSGGGRVIRC